MKHLGALAQVEEARFVSDPEKTGAAKYYFLVATGTCIDIYNHDMSAERLRAPVGYADTFTILGAENILPPELTRTLEKMVGFRKRLVHVYAGVDDRVIHEYLRTRLGGFQFQVHIRRFIS